ncbi:ATP-binding protein [Nostoc sp. NIES-2111]
MDTSAIFAQVRILLQRAREFQQQNQYDSAMHASARAQAQMADFKEHPLNLEAELAYADMLRTLGRNREAAEVLYQALPHVPKGAWLARFYNRLAGIYYEMPNNDSALFYGKKAIALTQPNQLSLQFRNEWLLGAIYRTAERYDEASEHLRRALWLIPEAELENRNVILTHLGATLEMQGRLPDALDTLQLALREARAHGTLAQREFASRSLFAALLRAGRTRDANDMFRQYIVIHDSLRDVQKELNIALLEAREEIAQQHAVNLALAEQAAREKNQMRLLTVGGIAALLLAGLMAAFYLTARRQKRLILSQNDILHLQQSELETKKTTLEDLNSSKDALLSVVSHDVRGPLLTLGSTLQLLAEGHLSEDETRHVLEGLAERVRDTETLLNDVLLWTKGNMQGLHVQAEAINPSPLIQEVLVQVRPLLQANRTTTTIEGEPSPMVADNGLLKVVLRNLLTNAIRHGSKDSVVTIRFQHTLDEAGISIIDQGPGMPAPLIQRLTMPTAANLPTREMLSLGGLGLVLVKDFVLRQHGRIEVDSSHKGTTITVWLRMARGRAAESFT